MIPQINHFVYSSVVTTKFEICKCGRSKNGTCIKCTDNKDIDHQCYDCDQCKHIRATLATYQEDFKFIGYIKVTRNSEEVWLCYECQKYITFRSFPPSIYRDNILYKIFTEHKNHNNANGASLCNQYKNNVLLPRSVI